MASLITICKMNPFQTFSTRGDEEEVLEEAEVGRPPRDSEATQTHVWDGSANAQEVIRMLLSEIETVAVDQAEDRVREVINILNSSECKEFIGKKKAEINRELIALLEATNSLHQPSPPSTVFCIFKSLRDFINRHQFDLFSNEETFTRLFSVQTLTYILHDAIDDLYDESKSPEMKMELIWEKMIEGASTCNQEDRLRSELEAYLIQWEKCYSGTSKELDSAKITADFNSSIQTHRKAMESFLEEIQKYFDGIKAELTTVQNTIRNTRSIANLSGILYSNFICDMFLSTTSLNASFNAQRTAQMKVDSAIRNRGAERFLLREHPDWFPRICDDLKRYLKNEMSDDDLQRLLKDECLDEDLESFQKGFHPWVQEACKRVNDFELPTINSTTAILELKRLWTFTKAIVLRDDESMQKHVKQMNQMLEAACEDTEVRNTAPVISTGWIDSELHQLSISFLVKDSSCDKIDAILEALSIQYVHHQLVDEKDLKKFDYVLTFPTKSMREILYDIVSRVGEFARLRVACVLMGDYSMTSGPQVLNPAFNRIYGRGFHAPGFISTEFTFLDYNGEKYHCPTGWRRISLNVASTPSEFDRKYGGWHVAYHGTNHELACTILANGLRASSIGCYIKDSPVIYFSPSIKYSSHPRYSAIYQNAGQYLQMIFQVRVNPCRICLKEAGTLPGAFPPAFPNRHPDDPTLDEHFPENKNLEWLVKSLPGALLSDMADSFVIYGIMVRLYDSDPNLDPENAWWHETPGY